MATDSGSQVYERGLQLAEAGRHEEAIECIREHLRSSPSDFQALNDIGVILFCMGENDEAIEHFEKARGLVGEDESTELNWNLCEAYLSNDQPGFALRLFGEMERQETMNADLLNRAAEAFLRQEAYGNAIEMLLRSLEMSPSQEILKPMIDVIKSKRPNVALFCEAEKDGARELFEFLDKRFMAEMHVGKSPAEARPVTDWCDIAFFEGYSETLSDVSYLPQTPRIVVRLSEDDIYENRAANICRDNVDAVMVTGGPVVKEALVEKFAGIEKQTRVISLRHGVDTNRYGFADKGRGKRIACLDALGPKSNPMFLLQCMQKLNYIDNDYRLYLAGEFEDEATEAYVRYMSEEMGLSNVVFLDSGINNEAAWLRDKHYVVSASITGCGLGGVFKGMSCGLKPVVHNFPGVRDIFDSEFVFSLAENFCEQILSERYEPVRYRRIVEDRYSRESQMEAINDVLFRLEKEVAAESTAEAGVDEQDRYGWGPVGFGNGDRQEISGIDRLSDVNVAGPAGGSFEEPSSKVIPIKPIRTESLEIPAGPYESGPVEAKPAPVGRGGSINRMSADVLDDWRAFTDRMNEGGEASSEAGADGATDISPGGVTPLDLPPQKTSGRTKITELPAGGVRVVSSSPKPEVDSVPFT